MAVTASRKALITLDEVKAYISPEMDTTFTTNTEEVLQRLINYVSEFFESYTSRKLIKTNITEYWDGGFAKKLTKYLPVWAYKDDNDKVYLNDELYSYVNGTDKLFTITDTDDDSAISSEYYTIDPDVGAFHCDYTLTAERRRWKVEYTTGYWVNSSEVSSEWKQIALFAVNYLYDKEISMYTRGEGGAVIAPRSFPPQVMRFLDQNRVVRM